MVQSTGVGVNEDLISVCICRETQGVIWLWHSVGIDLTRKSSATASGSAPGSQVKYRSHQNGISSPGGGWLERLVRPVNGIASKSGMSRAASQNSGTQRYITHSWRPFFPVARTVSSLMYASETR